jgi:putative transposase
VKKLRFTKEQIVGILEESEAGVKTPELCRKHGISSCHVLRLEIEVRRHGD